MEEILKKIEKIRQHFPWMEKWHDIYTSLSFFPYYHQLSYEQQKTYQEMFQIPAVQNLIDMTYDIFYGNYQIKPKTIRTNNLLIEIYLNIPLNPNLDEFLKKYMQSDKELFKETKRVNDVISKTKHNISWELNNQRADEMYQHRLKKVKENADVNDYYFEGENPENIIWGERDHPRFYSQKENNPGLLKLKEKGLLYPELLEGKEHNQRQYVFGLEYALTDYINTPEYFRCYNINFPYNTHLRNYKNKPYFYSILTNNLFLYTALYRNDLLFPVRYVVENNILPKRKIPHSSNLSFVKLNWLRARKFVGIYLINKNQPFFIFEKDGHYEMTDFQIEERYPYSFSGLPSITYLELTHLCLYYDIYLYKVKEDKIIDDKKVSTYVFSRYGPDTPEIINFKEKNPDFLIDYQCGRFSERGINKNMAQKLGLAYQNHEFTFYPSHGYKPLYNSMSKENYIKHRTDMRKELNRRK